MHKDIQMIGRHIRIDDHNERENAISRVVRVAHEGEARVGQTKGE